MTGKLSDGNVVFLHCDGRSTICAQDGKAQPPSSPTSLCRDCTEFCKTHQSAVDALQQYFLTHPLEENSTLSNWAKYGIGPFKKVHK